MNTREPLRTIFSLTLVVLLMAGCGGARAGPAVVAGRVERDGQPVSDTEVTLAMTAEGGDAGSWDTQTDAEGEFVFEDVAPGSYYIITSIVIQGQAQCSTTSPGFGILQLAAVREDTGAPITIAMATGSEEPFEVSAGDRIDKDIVFHCR